MDRFKRFLKIAKELEDKSGERNTYMNLGVAHINLEHFKTAIGYLEHSLKLEKQLENKFGEANIYCNIGNAYKGLGEEQVF